MSEALAVTPVTMKKQHLGLLHSFTRSDRNLNLKLFFRFFSISNYPNYESHMPPPARFLDTGDKKSTGSSPRIRANPKLHRETFQINV